MRIEFERGAPQYRGWNMTVGFPARVDGVPVDCSISIEALEDHFGAASIAQADTVGAFLLHRKAIERVARRMLRATATRQLLLHSGHFRYDAQS